jgi:amidase
VNVVTETDEVLFAGAAEQARRIRTGIISAKELIEASLERIAVLDPRLNAFRVVRGERAMAEAADHEDGPLAGVPIAIKDDTDVAGELTCYGTSAHERRAQRDAPVVAQLRRAGAIVIGKTHVPELDSWGFTESLTFGVTRNPWDLSRTPGGSSGGSAVAVATGMCGVAHGTDGTGSLRNPASWCGIVGFKPGLGLISGPAALSGWHGMVVNGPMGRHVADVAAFLDATAAGDFSEATARPPGRLRIAMTFKPPPGMGGKLDEDRARAVHEAADLLRELGHEVVERDPALPKLTSLAIDARYFGGIADDVASLDHPERLERRTRSVARVGQALAPALRLAPRITAAAAAALDEVHKAADLLLFPGSVQGPEPIGRYHDRGALFTGYADTARVAFQPLWNLVGRPAVMLPWDLDHAGIPTSVQLGAPPRGEQLLLSLAAQIEAARPSAGRPPPLPTSQPQSTGSSHPSWKPAPRKP